MELHQFLLSLLGWSYIISSPIYCAEDSKPPERFDLLLWHVVKNLQADVDKLQGEVVFLQEQICAPNKMYIQFPDADDPVSVWPQCKWLDVTDNYKGLFFRAAGGSAEVFGTEQEENAPLIDQVQFGNDANPNNIGQKPILVTIKKDDWTPFILASSVSAEPRAVIDMLRFHSTGGEVRPKNTAIRIWQCLGVETKK